VRVLRITLLFLVVGSATGGKPPPVAKVSCIAENYPYDEYNSKTRKIDERQNWIVVCTITRGDKVLLKKRLLLPIGADFRDVMEAIDRFRTEEAPRLLKDK
jgi:hypothetical protein